MIQLMLKNYTRLGFINTGQYEIDRYREYARKTAEEFNFSKSQKRLTKGATLVQG
jgi:hypothetical protein